MTAITRYDTDFYAWTEEQIHMLRARRFDALDLIHLIEEIDDLGKREKRSLSSHLGVLLGHLLKWRCQPDYPHKKSWRATIHTQRRAVLKLLRDNPSLKPMLTELIAESYPDAMDLVVAETPLDYDALPRICPWTEEQILGDFWPGGGMS